MHDLDSGSALWMYHLDKSLYSKFDCHLHSIATKCKQEVPLQASHKVYLFGNFGPLTDLHLTKPCLLRV